MKKAATLISSRPTKAAKLRAAWVSASLRLFLFFAGSCVDFEGDTFSVHLVNDEEERLQFLQCKGDCVSFYRTPHVEPGESYDIAGTVGVINLWQVQDEQETVLGCFRIDFDERPEEESSRLYASRDLQACVE